MQRAVHQQAPDAQANSAGPSLLDLAIRTRKTRTRICGLSPAEIFSNSAGDMMIEFFITQAMNKRLCIEERILALRESSTSAMRRIDRLQGAGFIRRRLDDENHRRVWAELTDKGYTPWC